MSKLLRLFALLFLLTSGICYLKWPGHSATLFAVEAEILLEAHKLALVHPMVALPLIGQLTLIYALLRPGYGLVLSGAVFLSVIVLMVLITGLLSQEIITIGSTIPFIVAFILFVKNRKKLRDA